jgi:CheY-like chemotaxis protein
MTEEKQKKIVKILLIEDNNGDVRLTQEALKECNVANKLEVVYDGAEALDFLKRKGKYKNEFRPDLVLLDLNIPKINGKSVLARIKNDDSLKRIPIVVLTSSQAEEDIEKSYDLHANCYINKPLDIDSFMKIIQSISEFWFGIVKLPKE